MANTRKIGESKTENNENITSDSSEEAAAVDTATENKATGTAVTEDKTDTVTENKTETVQTTKSKENAKTETVKDETVKDETATSIDELTSVINSFAEGGSVNREGLSNKHIDPDKRIEVMSVSFGGLTWISEKTKSHYRWNAIGDIEYIPFDELISMHGSSRNFMFEPYVIILDPDVVNYFRLDSVYKEFAYVNKLEPLFEEGDMAKIEEALNKIKRTNMRNVAISKIRLLKDNGKLNNIHIIRLIQKILCFDLDDLK